MFGTAEARNPDLSKWTLNLSESAEPAELGEYDFAQEIEVVGSTVHVMWLTRNADWSGYKVYYRRSTDNGKTWQPKQMLFTDNDLVTDNTYKRMMVTGNTVHIAVNYYLGSWYGVLGYLRSTDNGATFEPIRNLFLAAGAWHVYDVRVAASNGKVSIGFRNQCNWLVNNDYYVLNSDDGGTNFTTCTVYSTTTGSSWLATDLQRIGDNIYVLYTDSYYYYGLQYSRLYLAASTDAGAHFTSTLISQPSKNGEHKTYSLQTEHHVPKIAGVGSNVSVIWSGLNQDDAHSIFYRRSTDSGTTWQDIVNLSLGVIPGDKVLESGQETLAAQGAYVYSLFVTTAGNVYLRRSTNSGASFMGLQELNSTNPDVSYIASGWWPVIKTDPTVADGSKVYVLWDWPTLCRSTDAGASFTSPELVSPRFSYGGSLTSGANRPYMTIAYDGSVHFVVEARYLSNSFGGYGDFDIFYRRLAPAPFSSAGSNGLRLASNIDDARYDNMQVRSSTALNFSSQMTGEIWVFPSPGGNTTGTSLSAKPIFHKLNTGDFSYALQTYDYYGNRRAAAQIRTVDGEFWVVPASETVGLVPDGSWSHLAFTYDAGAGADNFRLYMNGQLIGTTTATGNLSTTDGLFLLGYYGIWDVAELRLWSRPLNQTEIAANMSKRLIGTQPGLNAYYTFRNTTRDMTGNGNDGILMYMEQYIQQGLIEEIPPITPGIPLLLLSD
jgi:hypothetical protein